MRLRRILTRSLRRAVGGTDNAEKSLHLGHLPRLDLHNGQGQRLDQQCVGHQTGNQGLSERPQEYC